MALSFSYPFAKPHEVLFRPYFSYLSVAFATPFIGVPGTVQSIGVASSSDVISPAIGSPVSSSCARIALVWILTGCCNSGNWSSIGARFLFAAFRHRNTRTTTAAQRMPVAAERPAIAPLAMIGSVGALHCELLVGNEPIVVVCAMTSVGIAVGKYAFSLFVGTSTVSMSIAIVEQVRDTCLTSSTSRQYT